MTGRGRDAGASAPRVPWGFIREFTSARSLLAKRLAQKASAPIGVAGRFHLTASLRYLGVVVAEPLGERAERMVGVVRVLVTNRLSD